MIELGYNLFSLTHELMIIRDICSFSDFPGELPTGRDFHKLIKYGYMFASVNKFKDLINKVKDPRNYRK